jgi:drug/metabolite transporter (DMT)-like permease
VVLAFLVFGEVLGPLQLLGGAFVIAAVLVLASSRPREVAEPAPANRPLTGAVASDAA